MHWSGLIPARGEQETIQGSLRQSIVTAIAEGRLRAGQQMPASRALAGQMGIARNTVIAVYEDLVARGFLLARERRGYFVGPQAAERVARDLPVEGDARTGGVDWDGRFAVAPSALRNMVKPTDWQRYAFPFIYGQVDPELFPIAVWRACSRAALGRSAVNYWAADLASDDDPLLVEQLCRHILPEHGIYARPEEVLITLGSQHGLYLLSQILVRPGDVTGIEDPGYPDARNIFGLSRGTVRSLPVDAAGLVVGPALDGLRQLVVTPAHQCPTMVTMPAARRRALLDWAERTDAVLIEDDYEGETRFDLSLPSLKSMDRAGRVVYLGTLSKVLAPGVRLGFLVGPSAVVREARALRRLMHRSAPLNNQRTVAVFLAEGHCQGLLKTLRATLKARWAAAVEAVDRSLPDFERSASTGGSSLWLGAPPDIDPCRLDEAARARGVLFERGEAFFADPARCRHFRLGLSSIATPRIPAGIRVLAEAVAAIRAEAG